MPMLGIMASQISGHLSSYESIATVSVGGGGLTTATFSSIPQTYTHLQIRAIGRTTAGGSAGDNTLISFNSDTTAANYTWHNILGDGATASAQAYTAARVIANAAFTSSTSLANTFGVFVCDILDYTNASKNKTVRSLNGADQNGSGRSMLNSLVWLSSSAITQIDLTAGGGNFVQYTQFALYGLKG